MIACLNMKDPAVQNMISLKGEKVVKAAATSALDNGYVLLSDSTDTSRLFNDLLAQFKNREEAFTQYVNAFHPDVYNNVKSFNSQGEPTAVEVTNLLAEKNNVISKDEELTKVMNRIAPSIAEVKTTKVAKSPVSVVKSGSQSVISIHTAAKPMQELAHAVVSVFTRKSKEADINRVVRLLEGSKVKRNDVEGASETYNNLKFIGDAIAKGDNAFSEGDLRGKDWNEFRDLAIENAAPVLGMSVEALTELSQEYLSDIQEGISTPESRYIKYTVSVKEDIGNGHIQSLMASLMAKMEAMAPKLEQWDANRTKRGINLPQGISDMMRTLNREENRYRVLSYIAFANNYSWAMDKSLKEYLDNPELVGKDTSLEDIRRYKDFAALMDEASVLRDLARQDPELMEFLKESKVVNMLDSIVARKDAILSGVTSLERTAWVAKYAPMLQRPITEFKDKTRRELKSARPELSDFEVEQEIERMLSTPEMQRNIENQQRVYMSNLFLLMPQDINGVESFAVDSRSMNNEIISIVTQLMDKADMQTRKRTIEMTNAVNQVYKEFDAATEGLSAYDKYKPFIVERFKLDDKGRLLLDENDNLVVEPDKGGIHYVAEYYTPVIEEIDYLAKKLRALEPNIKSQKGITASSEGSEVMNKLTRFADYNEDLDVWEVKDKFKDKRYEQIQANPIQKKMYDALMKYNTIADSMVPQGLRLGYRIPSVEKSTYERMDRMGVIDAMKREGLDTFTIRQSEEMEFAPTNSTTRMIPIYYRTPIEADDISYDLFHSAVMNFNTSMNYHYKNMVRADVDAAMDIMAEARVGELSMGKSREKVIRGSERPTISSDYDDPFAVIIRNEGGGYTTYKASTISGRDSNAYKALQHTIETRLYNMQSLSSPMASKLTRKLIGYVSKVFLSFNFLGATKNALMGNLNNLIAASGDTYINSKNMAKAYKMYTERGMFEVIKDIGKPTPESLTGRLMERFNVSANYEAGGKRNYLDRTLMKRVGNLQWLESIYSGPEHMISAVIMEAHLDATKVIGKDGKKHSMRDAYEIKDGFLVVKEGYQVSEDLEFTIGQRIENMKRQVQGNYDSRNKSLMQRYWAGQLVNLMRKWVVTGYVRRYRGLGNVLNGAPFMGGEVIPKNSKYGYINPATGEYEEGMYTTTLRYLFNLYGDVQKYKFDLISNVADNWNKLDAADKNSIIKTSFELGMVALLLGASSVLRLAALDEDDDDARERLFFALYQLKGMQSELQFFANPVEATNLLKSPSIVIPWLEKVGSTIRWSIDPFAEYETGNHVGENKFLYNLQSASPFKNGIPFIITGTKTNEEAVQALYK